MKKVDLSYNHLAHFSVDKVPERPIASERTTFDRRPSAGNKKDLFPEPDKNSAGDTPANRPTNITKLLLSYNRLTSENFQLVLSPTSASSSPVQLFSHLCELRLKSNLFDNTIFSLINHLSLLKTLDLSHNKLTLLPQSLSSLSNLQELNFLGNQIAEIEEGLVLPLLSSLNLSRNKLVSFGKVCRISSKLTHLYLSFNRIQRISKSTKTLRNLLELTLNNNQIKEIPPQTLSSLSMLAYLDLSFNKLRDFPEELTKLSFLSTLLLRNNQLSSLPDSISLLSLLTEFNIERNLFPKPLCSLPPLTLDVEEVVNSSQTEEQATTLEPPESISSSSPTSQSVSISSDSPATPVETTPTQTNTTELELASTQLPKHLQKLAELQDRSDKRQLVWRSNMTVLPYVGMDTVDKIIDGLYLGGVMGASNKDLLLSLNITHILTVSKTIPILYPKDFEYEMIAIDDAPSENIFCRFLTSNHFIDSGRSRGAVLVHCAAGISRSSSCVIAYLMSKNQMTFRKGLSHVKGQRSCIRPNFGFEKQLEDLEDVLKKNPFFPSFS
eukprot:TRINITY_DN6884_c0_g1_i1.p1 TRINITY_DN6884_c0_g1~~TRINITY_DN6884_c0_g1_i1.p1  ORF type:complete len:553 (-),score=112.86 TRINITY_DN6884_c0_g1_i1:169-1827(-)